MFKPVVFESLMAKSFKKISNNFEPNPTLVTRVFIFIETKYF